MYDTVMAILLLFPWSLIGLMLLNTVGRRLRKVIVRSR